MRCPSCNTENDDGASFCINCATPLTAYGGQVTGEVNKATLQCLSKLSVRPQVLKAVAGINIVGALVLLIRTLQAFSTKPTINSEGTNYIGAAFGMLGAVMVAAILIPIALLFLYSAWGAWNQRTWAWYSNAGLLALYILVGLRIMGFMGIVAICAAGATTVFWFHRDTREWFGTQ